MENEDRIKALNILFAASALSLFLSIILAEILTLFISYDKIGLCIGVLSPTITYIVGRILCFKEYDE